MKKALSLFIALILTMSVAVTGFAADQEAEGELDGTSSVNNVTLNVLLPTDLNFALDPLEIATSGVTGSQVASTDYMIVNKTDAPVQIELNLTAIPKDNTVKLVNDNTTLKQDDTTVTTKEIYFAAIGADTITPGDLAFDKTSGVTTTFNYDKAKDTLVGLKVVTEGTTDIGKAKGSISFALGAATGSPLSTLAAGNKGVASFKFYGEMNTYANWAAGDVTVKGAYKLTPLRKTTYSNYGTTTGTYTADGWGVQLAVASKLGFLTGTGLSNINNTAKTATYTYTGSVTSSTIIPFSFGAGDPTISSIMFGSTALPSDLFTKAQGGFLLGAGCNAWPVGNVGDITIKLSDNTSWTVTIIKN